MHRRDASSHPTSLVDGAQVIVMPDFRRPPDASSADALDDVRAAYERVLELGAVKACVGGDSAGGGLALVFAIKIRDAGATPDGRDGAWSLPAPAGCLAISPWVDLGEERIGGSRLSNERWDFLPGDMIDLLARETVEASGSDASRAVWKSNVTAIDRRPASARSPPVRCGLCVKNYRVHPRRWVSSPVKFDLHVATSHLNQTGSARCWLTSKCGWRGERRRQRYADDSLTVFRDMPHVSPIFSFCHETPRTALRQAGARARVLGDARRRGVLVDVVSARGLRRGLFAKAPRVGVALLKDGGRRERARVDGPGRRRRDGDSRLRAARHAGQRRRGARGGRTRAAPRRRRAARHRRGDHRRPGPEGDVTKAERALDGAQPAILMASMSYVDDASFVLPSGVATAVHARCRRTRPTRYRPIERRFRSRSDDRRCIRLVAALRVGGVSRSTCFSRIAGAEPGWC